MVWCDKQKKKINPNRLLQNHQSRKYNMGFMLFTVTILSDVVWGQFQDFSRSSTKQWVDLKGMDSLLTPIPWACGVVSFLQQGFSELWL